MNLGSFRSVYFLGIGGIGMSALARFMHTLGIFVSGYDRTPTSLTDELISEGMEIHFKETPGLIPENPDLVIYTPAIPADNKELLHIKNRGYPLKKRAEVLGLISSGSKTIAVAGTHGKTTTTTLIAHILNEAGYSFMAFLGGISKNYNTNFISSIDLRKIDKSGISCLPEYIIVEADEYDRSFLHLHPSVAVITSADADHLDIYTDIHQLHQSFRDFTKQIIPGGTLLVKNGLQSICEPANAHCYSYTLNAGGQFHGLNIHTQSNATFFDFVTPDFIIEGFSLGLPGIFNLENAIAASAVALLTGVSDVCLKSALKSFQGVRRRFDFRITRDEMIYIDDYAHHPEELKSCISAVRDLFPGKKIVGIFQPHLFTRTRDFANEFARSLELLDELILLEIYPAREKTLPGINARFLLDKVNLENKMVCPGDQLLQELGHRKPELLLTLGAGDIDQFADPIVRMFTKRFEHR